MDRIESFNEYRSYLFSIAYRMLGSAMDAEDMVQETFLRWQRAELEPIESPRAYLATVITRLCIDYLRSARVQRETYVGPWLPEPLITDSMPGPAENLALAESLSMAFLVMLEQLSPTERAIFLLRQVFDYDYAEIAPIVGKSEANCRQILRRARERIHLNQPRFEVSLEQQNMLVSQFVQACINGDMAGLMNTLAEDITMWNDGGGIVNAARNPIYTAEKVSRFLISVTQKLPANYVSQFAIINNQPGFIIYVDDHPVSTIVLEIGRRTPDSAARIQNLRIVANPEKLRNLPPLKQN